MRPPHHLRERGRAECGLVLMGFSMGTSAALRAAAAEPDIRAVVLEAPFDTYRETVAHHGWLFYRHPALGAPGAHHHRHRRMAGRLRRRRRGRWWPPRAARKHRCS